MRAGGNFIAQAEGSETALPVGTAVLPLGLGGALRTKAQGGEMRNSPISRVMHATRPPQITMRIMPRLSPPMNKPRLVNEWNFSFVARRAVGTAGF